MNPKSEKTVVTPVGLGEGCDWDDQSGGFEYWKYSIT